MHAYDEMPEETSPDHVLWFVFADSSRKHVPLHFVRYEHVVQDLLLRNPEFLDVRHLERGVQRRNNVSKRSAGRNLHCIMLFRSQDVQDFSTIPFQVVEPSTSYASKKSCGGDDGRDGDADEDGHADDDGDGDGNGDDEPGGHNDSQPGDGVEGRGL